MLVSGRVFSDSDRDIRHFLVKQNVAAEESSHNFQMMGNNRLAPFSDKK